jgi:hypothetical protein
MFFLLPYHLLTICGWSNIPQIATVMTFSASPCTLISSVNLLIKFLYNIQNSFVVWWFCRSALIRRRQSLLEKNKSFLSGDDPCFASFMYCRKTEFQNCDWSSSIQLNNLDHRWISNFLAHNNSIMSLDNASSFAMIQCNLQISNKTIIRKSQLTNHTIENKNKGVLLEPKTKEMHLSGPEITIEDRISRSTVATYCWRLGFATLETEGCET